MNKITLREIKALMKGKTPERLQHTPFAVIRYSVRIPWSPDVVWEYAITLSPEEKQAVVIPSRDAKKIIRLNKLEPTHENLCGTVFELPERPFMHKFCGHFHEKETEARIRHEELCRRKSERELERRRLLKEKALRESAA